MNPPRIYHTLRARFEASERFQDKGQTAQASDLNQATITETMIEILAALEEISETLKSWSPGPEARTGPPSSKTSAPAQAPAKKDTK